MPTEDDLVYHPKPHSCKNSMLEMFSMVLPRNLPPPACKIMSPILHPYRELRGLLPSDFGGYPETQLKSPLSFLGDFTDWSASWAASGLPGWAARASPWLAVTWPFISSSKLRRSKSLQFLILLFNRESSQSFCSISVVRYFDIRIIAVNKESSSRQNRGSKYLNCLSFLTLLTGCRYLRIWPLEKHRIQQYAKVKLIPLEGQLWEPVSVQGITGLCSVWLRDYNKGNY